LSAIVSACGRAITQHGGESDTSGPGDDTATTAMFDATGPQGTRGDTVSSTTGSETGVDETDDLPKWDVATKLDVGRVLHTCAASEVQAVDLEVVTPSGPFAAAYAWWAWEYCCIADPWLIVTEVPELEVVDRQIATKHVVVFVPGEWGQRGAYFGELAIGLREGEGGPFSEHETGFVLLEALDPEVPPNGELPLFSATFAIDGNGWTMAGSVTAPYCPEVEGPRCPCE
jgi:hypothetical protein